jgi:hypothetical protein
MCIMKLPALAWVRRRGQTSRQLPGWWNEAMGDEEKNIDGA